MLQLADVNLLYSSPANPGNESTARELSGGRQQNAPAATNGFQWGTHASSVIREGRCRDESGLQIYLHLRPNSRSERRAIPATRQWDTNNYNRYQRTSLKLVKEILWGCEVTVITVQEVSKYPQ